MTTLQWQGWEDLGGPITSSPAVTSWGPARLDVFAAGAEGLLLHKLWNGKAWSNWETLGGTFKGGPAAVSWGGGDHRIDVFVRGMNDHLWHKWFATNAWHNWQDLGGTLTSSPAVTAWAGTSRRLDVFAAGADGQLIHKLHEGNAWHNWETLGGTFKGAPAAVSWGAHRIDVFVQGTNDHLGHLWWDHKKPWHGWQDLSIDKGAVWVGPGKVEDGIKGTLASPPAVASWDWGRLDVFFASIFGGGGPSTPPQLELAHMWWDDTIEPQTPVNPIIKRKWSSFELLGGKFYDNPAAVSKAPHEIDVFIRGKDNHLGHRWTRGPIPI